MNPTILETPRRDGPAPWPPERHEQPLHVVHVSTTDLRGGAARAALRLHRALPTANVRSQMYVAQRFGAPGAEVFELNPCAPAPALLGRALFRLGRRWHRPPLRKTGGYFSPDWTVTGWRLPSLLPRSAVVNLHWVTDLLDFRTLPALAVRAPIVWTLHDMNVFTGGCHYSGSCERYVATCGSCPQLAQSTGDDDLTGRVLARKAESFAALPPERLRIVCPSRWLAREAQRSSLLRRFDVRVIPNGLDLHEYRPVPRREGRQQLNLPEDATVVLFVAESISDRRKGFDLLREALVRLRDVPRLLLVTLGSNAAALPVDLPAVHLGALPQPGQLRAAYSAADVFAIPSLQDNLPNTVIEAMACGTPVVGFDTGGVGEAIVDGETGVLVPLGDAPALAAALRRVLEDRALRTAMAGQARRRVEREYSVELQARRYADVYAEAHEAFAATPQAQRHTGGSTP